MPENSRACSGSPPRSPVTLPAGARELTERDFFLKNDEFRTWLKEEKEKYFTDLSSEKARSYFRKFIKAWNRGKLSRKYYQGLEPQETTASSSSTKYKWSFAETVSEKDIVSARKSVLEDNYGPSAQQFRSKSGPAIVGPQLPSTSDRQFNKEEYEELQSRQEQASRKRARNEERDRIEDAVGPKEVGREGMMENKRAKREQDRSFREKSPGGDEFGDDVLMGGDSFKARIARRDAARNKLEEKRRAQRNEREVLNQERVESIKSKDKATMDMFKALAKERFG